MKDCNGYIFPYLKFRPHSSMAVAVKTVTVFGEEEEKVARGSREDGPGLDSVFLK